MQCNQCGSQDLGEVKSGISKKGNAYKGRKCNTCQAFVFMPTGEPKQSPAPQGANPQTAIANLLVKQNEILKQILDAVSNKGVVPTVGDDWQPPTQAPDEVI